MRRALLGTSSVAILLLIGALSLKSDATGAAAAQNDRHWIKLTFGLDGEVADWDGNLSIQNGAILTLKDWAFEKDHRFNVAGRSWKCSTFVDNVRERSTWAEPYRGLLVELESQPNTVLHVNTLQGYVRVTVGELEAGKPTVYLDGRASAELLGSGQPLFGDRGLHPELNETRADEDFPTLAVDGNGHRWVAWIDYDDEAKADRLSALDLDDPRGKVERIDAGRLQANPRLVADGDGNLLLFWTAPDDENNWDIRVSRRVSSPAARSSPAAGATWTAPELVTTAAGSDFHFAAAAGPQGDIWLAWQSFRNGNGDIYTKRLHAGQWSDDISVAGTDANEWEPALSVAPDGTAWIAYDTYQHGNYDVYLTSLAFDADGRPKQTPAVPIAATPDFEAHASVEASEGNTVWVAYDAAGPNWGKDILGGSTDYKGAYHEPLHANRRLELRAYRDGKFYRPGVELPQRLDTLRPKSVLHRTMGEVKRFYEAPQLARDHEGRLWLFFRLNRQGYAEDPIAALWEIHATTFAGGKWIEPILLPDSGGRQEQRVEFVPIAESRGGVAGVGAAGTAGFKPPVAASERSPQQTAPDVAPGLYCAWSAGHHFNDVRQSVRVGRLPALNAKPAEPPLTPLDFDKPAPSPEKPVRSWTLRHRGKDHHVYFGDMHRHTEISWCYPTVDGSLVDAHRYALDAARLDFLVVTDHTRDTDPYPWWRTQKAADLFHIPGTFASIYGYERSNDTPGGGHRNVFFLKRDWQVYRDDHYYKQIGKPPEGRNDPVAALYPHLRGKDAFTAAHTPAYSPNEMRGTWSYDDAEAEPLVEVFQGFRRDYLRPGDGVREEASIWYALSRGYRLGFIASSDHVSTHKSYACVWAEGPSREQIFQALRARRTYAATDKILLEFRLGNVVMGEETRVMGKPELSIRVHGTAPVDRIDIIRNRQTVSQTSPGKADVQMKFVDDEFPGGPAWYYVSIEQSDGNRAWASPIWVE